MGIVAAAPSGLVAEVQRQMAAVTDVPTVAVAGGVLRQDSVRAMLQATPSEATHVLVHDAARALVPLECVERVVKALGEGRRAVIPVLPVVDTIVEVSADRVVRGVDRDRLRRVQTPQGFEIHTLRHAHAEAPSGFEATDDASLVARLGVDVYTVMGDPAAMKITVPHDLAVAELLAES